MTLPPPPATGRIFWHSHLSKLLKSLSDRAAQGRLGSLIAGLLAVLLASAAMLAPGTRSGLSGLSVDTLFWLRDSVYGQRRPAAASPVAVILIDEATYNTPPFQGLSKELWTPQLATVIRAVNQAAPRAIGMDFVLPTSMETVQPGYERDFRRALKEAGELPERITHNDTKLNNVLLDDATGEGLCVLDLDTVMPGLSLYDFGDLVRTATNPVAEDSLELDQVKVQVPMFQALARGYLEGTGGTLLPAERERLVLAGKLLTYENALRFLSDFLDGDRYYPVRREAHNLDRCRTQLALLASLDNYEERLMAYVRSLEA